MRIGARNPQGALKRAALFIFSLVGVTLWLFYLGVINVYWSVIVGVLSLWVVHVLFPSFGFRQRHLFSLSNFAYGIFLIQIVVLPALAVIDGLARNTLPYLPTTRWINIAILINVLAFISFAAGYQLSSSRRNSWTKLRKATVSCAKSSIPSFIVVLYFIVGSLGYWLEYRSVSNYFSLAIDSVGSATTAVTANSQLSGAASTFLQPFLLSAVVMWWTLRVQKQLLRQKKSWSPYTSLAVIVLLVLILTLNYNRGGALSVLLPVVGVFFTRVRRLTLKGAVLGAVALVGFTLIWGAGFAIQFNFTSAEGIVVPSEAYQTLANFVQVYAGGPQFNAFLLQSSGWENRLYLGSTLLSSLLYPVPIIGSWFRSGSGVVLYNQLIYLRSGIIDQVIPLSGELMINFHVAGVTGGFALFGILVCWIQSRIDRANNLYEVFVWFTVGFWMLFMIPGSLAVAAQAVVFFYWPFYIYFGLKWGANYRHIVSKRSASPNVGDNLTEMITYDRSTSL